MKIIIGGPPHSGKSCLRYALKEAVKNEAGDVYPYIITACPDGEGSWFHEVAGQNPDLGRELKAGSKGKFTPELVDLYSSWVETCNNPLTLIDIGGLPDAYNKKICKAATHAILITSDMGKLAIWRSFCAELSLNLIAELRSNLCAKNDEPLQKNNGGAFYGSIHGLERGDLTIPLRPTVRQLASLLVKMSAQEKHSEPVREA